MMMMATIPVAQPAWPTVLASLAAFLRFGSCDTIYFFAIKGLFAHYSTKNLHRNYAYPVQGKNEAAASKVQL